MSPYCCEMMAGQLEQQCPDHADPFDCPDKLIVQTDNTYGLIIHDGGNSSIKIAFCPWCGTRIKTVTGEKPRRWFRFSLRTLFVLVTVAAIVIACGQVYGYFIAFAIAAISVAVAFGLYGLFAFTRTERNRGRSVRQVCGTLMSCYGIVMLPVGMFLIWADQWNTPLGKTPHSMPGLLAFWSAVIALVTRAIWPVTKS